MNHLLEVLGGMPASFWAACLTVVVSGFLVVRAVYFFSKYAQFERVAFLIGAGVLMTVVMLASVSVADKLFIAPMVMKERRVRAMQKAEADSIMVLKRLDNRLPAHMTAVRDSLERAIEAVTHGTYPLPARIHVRWAVLEKPDTAYIGMYMYELLSIALTSDAFRSIKALEGTISHEVGHSLEPLTQLKIAESDSLIASRYGPNHLQKLLEFQTEFQNLSLRKDSFLRSKKRRDAWPLSAVEEGSMDASAFHGQYVAELLSCYFNTVCDRGGELSKAERDLAEKYAGYLEGKAFPRDGTHYARLQILNRIAPLAREYYEYYRKK